MRSFFGEFKKFVVRGNMMDMAIGIVVGTAFAAVIKSLVDHILMPPIGMLIDNTDFSNLFVVLKEGATAAPYASLEIANKAGAVVFAYGAFITEIVKLIMLGMALFLAVRSYNRFKRKDQEVAPAATTEEVKLLGEIRDLLKTS